MGGRAARTDPMYGNIYDHFAVEYEYPNGARVLSMCRQTAGAAENVSERVVGTTGFSYTDSADGYIKGQKALREPAGLAQPVRRGARRPHREHQGGQAPERGAAGRGELLTAIMGRMSAYTGRALSWDWVMNASKLDLTPPHMEWKDLPPLEVAVPGETPLV